MAAIRWSAVFLSFGLVSAGPLAPLAQTEPVTAQLPKTADAKDSVPDAARALLGGWQNDEKGRAHFEPARVIFARQGTPVFFRAKYEPGKLLLYQWARQTTIEAKLADGVLTLTWPDGKRESFRKVDGGPGELEVKPLVLGEARELPADRIKAIQEELRRRRDNDQLARRNPEKAKELGNVDADNTAYLKKLVREVGWIDASRFGAEASSAAFLLVQHSMDLPLMLAALPAIEKDVKDKKLRDSQPYALLYDRVKIQLGCRQKYGTQLGTNDQKEWVVMPLVDRGKVDEFRKEIGLFPLAQYLKAFKNDVKFLED
jgi:hypothetical protein